MPTEFALSSAALTMASLPDETVRVLEERARQLARPIDGGAVPETTSLRSDPSGTRSTSMRSARSSRSRASRPCRGCPRSGPVW